MMDQDEFEARIAFHRDQMHQAFRDDHGSIADLERNGRVILAAMDFIAQVHTIAEGEGAAELVMQAEVMGVSIGGLLANNTVRLMNAHAAEAELQEAMAQCSQQFVTIH